MALLKYIIPTLFFVFSLGEIARIGLLPGVNTGLFDVVLLVAILTWLPSYKKTKYFLKKPILLFSLVAFISLLININNFSPRELGIASLYLIRFIFYAGIYFVFVDIGRKYKEKIPKYMLFSEILIILFGLLQYFFYPSLKNLYYLGWDDHMYRLFSTFLDPNFTGTILVLLLVFTFILKDKLFSKKKMWLGYITLVLNFLAIILSYSRGAILMLLVCVVVYSALSKNWKITGLIIAAFIVVFFILSPKFYVENTNLLRFASAEARIETSKKALQIYQKNPLGVGFNTYRFARARYENADWTGFGPSHAGGGVDNSFILVLVTTGVIGFASYLFLVYKIFRLGLNRIEKDKTALVLVVSLSGLVINAMFINSLFYSFITVWIWMLAGLTESSSRE